MTNSPYRAIEWRGDAATGTLDLLDQTRLPAEYEQWNCRQVETVWQAIRELKVRGAPAIGVAAAYGIVLGMQSARGGERAAFDQRLDEVCRYLAGSRPTAVNLFWAIERMRQLARFQAALPASDMHDLLLEEARQIESEDKEMCAAIGRFGAELIEPNSGVLTHCNTGGLATAGDGTAFAVLAAAHADGKNIHVYADETRPLLQGSRLTAWELMRRGIPMTLITDSMAAWVMKLGRVQAAIVGADRITANGDAANKIGTYSVATLCKAHGIPFYVAAPSSTFDLSLATGDQIPIEERAAAEITHPGGVQLAPESCPVFNPAFDVTPAALITALITEKGVIRPVTAENIRRVLGQTAERSVGALA